MKQLWLAVFLSLAVAIAITASADQAPATVGEGEFGCCCAWTEWAGQCPMDLLAFFGGFDDVCFVLDEAGEVTGFCSDDPDGFYPFRGMAWDEVAAFISANYGIEPTVGSMLDFFCGIDRTHAPGGE